MTAPKKRLARAGGELAQVVPLRPQPGRQVQPRHAKSRPRRSWGQITKLRSGRFQARYRVSGEFHYAPITFETRTDASAWLAMRQAELLEHRWKPAPPPEPGRVGFISYATEWLTVRELGPRTRAEYEKILAGRLAWFTPYNLDEITPATVKAWWQAQGPEHPTARRRAYDLLRAILNTATRPDEDTDAPPLLAANPARLTNRTLRAEVPKTRTRIKPATLQEVESIAAAMPERYRAMVLLAAWCAPRFGELTELRRRDVTLLTDRQGQPSFGVLHITRAVVWTDAHTPVVKEPKSEAGIRDIAVPPHVVPDLEYHLDNWTDPDPDALLFPAVESGGHMKHGALYKVFRRARSIAGRPDLRWHDLRHTGATMAAQAGATLAELMNRLGHSDVRAALIYQHASADRDAHLAQRLSELATTRTSES